MGDYDESERNRQHQVTVLGMILNTAERCAKQNAEVFQTAASCLSVGGPPPAFQVTFIGLFETETFICLFENELLRSEPDLLGRVRQAAPLDLALVPPSVAGHHEVSQVRRSCPEKVGAVYFIHGSN